MLSVSGDVATLFLMMAVGFLLRKIKKLPSEVLPAITFLLLYVVTPCLMVNAMQVERSAELLSQMGVTAAAGAVYFAAAIPVALLFYRKKEPETRSVLRFGSVYMNNAFMGIPLAAAVLGPESALPASVMLVFVGVMQWTAGIAIVGGRPSLKKTFLNPGIIGFAVGIALFSLKITLPRPIAAASSNLASMNTPLAMVVIGAQMADADILGLFREKSLYLAALLKLVVFPGALALLLLPLSLPPIVYATVVLLCATPTAAITSMFAQMFGRDTECSSRVVSLTTLCSIVTLPVFAVLVRGWL
jgi:predicted permease